MKTFSMNISNLISYELPVLTLQDTGERALQLMQEHRVFHLPLVQRDNYLALISEDDLLDWDTPEEQLSFAEFVSFRPKVFETMHPFDAAKTAKECSLSVIPVVNEHNHYVGMVTIEKLFNFLTDNTSIIENGAIIVLELEERNYSLSEIARICESNETNILGSNIKKIENTGLILVTIKINKNDTQAVIATFERYNYNVLDVFSIESTEDDLQENYDAFMRFINM